MRNSHQPPNTITRAAEAMASAPAGVVIDATVDNFQAEVIESDQPVLVDEFEPDPELALADADNPAFLRGLAKCHFWRGERDTRAQGRRQRQKPCHAE